MAKAFNTPAKRTAAQIELSPYANRLPQPTSEVNKVEYDKHMAARGAIQIVITHMQNDPDHAHNCFKAVRELEEAKQHDADAAGCDWYNIKCLKSAPLDFKARYLAHVSDLTVEEILNIVGLNPGVEDRLIVFATQVSITAKLPET